MASLHPNKAIKPSLQILHAALKMQDLAAAEWWNKTRKTLKRVESWAEFAGKVQDHFIPSNWCLDMLAIDYVITQGLCNSQTFVAELQTAHNTLTSAGISYTLIDSIFQNHLLFFSHPILQLCVHINSSLVYVNIKVDFIALCTPALACFHAVAQLRQTCHYLL